MTNGTGRLRRSVGRALQVLALNGGASPLVLARALRGVPLFVRDALSYRRSRGSGRFPLRLDELFPVLVDRFEASGSLGHYFYQDLWAAQKIYRRGPVHHVDIGSRIDGFVAHVLVFMPVTVVDVRPLPARIEGLSFIQDDATSLASIADCSLESVSSLHAVEHFGLGRYGDRVDPLGPFKMMATLARVLRPGGHLYLSVPVGRERLEFNAHRIFSPQTVLEACKPLNLVSFAAVTDEGDFLDPCEPERVQDSNYACGMYELTRE